jgi:hypothetical protein
MKSLLWSVVYSTALYASLCALPHHVLTSFQPSAFAQTTGQSTTTIQKKKKSFREKLGISYWSMFTGPGLGQGLDSSVDATGSPLSTGSNYFQMFIGTYEVANDIRLGTQLRVSTDFRDDQFQLLNPRLLAKFSNIIDNDFVNLSLQPMLEIPTTAVTRGRTLQAGVLFAHNWSFKVADPKWMLFMMTMTNANFYKSDTGFRTTEYIVMPMIGYQIHKDWQIMSWGWFDWAHNGGTGGMQLNDWGDNYVRLGVNYSVTPTIQIYPCVQAFTDNPTLNTSTIGLELSATL